jgi:hypothetical protein
MADEHFVCLEMLEFLVAIDGKEQSCCSSQGSEFGGDLPVNEVTWPKLAHRHLVTLIEVKKKWQSQWIETKGAQKAH